MAGNRTKEPLPRRVPKAWEAYPFTIERTEPLSLPIKLAVSYQDVLEGRRSAVGTTVSWQRVGELLWLATGTRGSAPSGRAGLPIEWRPTPSPGGLHAVHIVCISSFPREGVRLYQPNAHTFGLLGHIPAALHRNNRRLVNRVVGPCEGTTLRFVADMSKLEAAYTHTESLLLREVGCLMGVLALSAEAMGLTCCSLGFLDENIAMHLGWPRPRFRGIGGLQIGERKQLLSTNI